MGASKPEQVLDNLKALEVNLSKETLDEIDKVLENRPQVWYRDA